MSRTERTFQPPRRARSMWSSALAAMAAVAAVCVVALLGQSCGSSCEEGAVESGGPQCCSGGCGSSTTAALPRVCKGGEWVCEGQMPVLLTNCASLQVGCQQKLACSGIPEEPDPAPELCCDLSCDGAKAAHRVCGPTGVKFVCPGGYVPLSQCPDPINDCGGAVRKYRDNGFKLP